MIQKTFKITEKSQITDILDELKKYDEERSVLFLIAEYFPEDDVREIVQLVQKQIPGLKIAGMSGHNREGFFNESNGPGNIKLSLISFQESYADFLLYDLEHDTEWSAARCTKEQIRKLTDAKGIFIISSGTVSNLQVYLDSLHQNFPQVPVCGVEAAEPFVHSQQFQPFLICDGTFCRHAILTIIFHGKKLLVQAKEEFGWTEIGRKMTVTEMAADNIVKTIDHSPAASIYKQYLGLDYLLINPDNVCEFPLVRITGNIPVPYIALEAYEDGSVRYGFSLKEGDTIRFTYGNPAEILAESEEMVNGMNDFSPEAVLHVSCLNRAIFLHEDWNKEQAMFYHASPQAMMFYGNSEMYMDESGGGVLSSVLLYMALREGKNEQAPQKKIEVWKTQAEDDRIPLARRLLTFLDVTTRELEDLRDNLTEEVDRKTKEILRQQDALNQAHLQIVMTLSNAIDAKDAYTNGHSLRVAQYSKEISRRYGYDEKNQDEVYMIGLLHDVGKIGVPDRIINKPGRLNDEEFAEIKKHPAIGAGILRSITEYPEIAYGAHYHHERYDGSGYPEGLKGEEIPEIAQIISVADAYDAMTSNRSYRQVMEQAKVRSEIEQGRGTQFSPRFADIMLEIIDEDTDYKLNGMMVKRPILIGDAFFIDGKPESGLSDNA